MEAQELKNMKKKNTKVNTDIVNHTEVSSET